MLQSKIYANKAKMEPTCMHSCAGADWSRNEFNRILTKDPFELILLPYIHTLYT